MRVLLVVMVLVTSAAFSGNTYPTGYFRSPVGIDILLSGSFGEMRSSHFHSGIDIRTRGRAGYRIYAAADGFISRISVSPTGFGNALYVQHPNGYTTVYGHLLRFDDDIADFVKRAQYRQQSFDLNLYPESDVFPLKKGQVIALSGNSGSSGGPHLHFEIRDSKTQEPINPMLFDLPIRDTQRPGIRSAKLYAKDPESFAVIHRTTGRPLIVSMLHPVRLGIEGSGRSYKLAGVERIEARGNIGFGVEIRDTHNGSGFRLGAFRVQLFSNEELLWGYEMERLRFDQQRYLNAHIDYEERLRNRRWMERSFILPGNELPIYLQEGDGWLHVAEEENYDVRYQIEDAMGNASFLTVDVAWSAAPYGLPETIVPFVTMIPYNYPHVYTQEGLSLQFPAGAVYDDLPLELESLGPAARGYSDRYRIHDRFAPLHKPYELSISADRLPDRLQDKAVIVLESDEDDRLFSLGGSFENGYVTTRTRSFGQVFVSVDTLGPEITPLGFPNGRNFRSRDNIRIKVEDDLSGLASYEGTIDDKWILFEYDAKSDVLIHRFDGRITSGSHHLRLVARDHAGNESVFSSEISR